MVLQSRSIDSVVGETSADATQRVESQSSTTKSTAAGGQAGDSTNLSDASKFVSLAKTLTNPAYQNKIDRLAGQIRSGTYQVDTTRAGQNVVQDLLHFGRSSASSE